MPFSRKFRKTLSQRAKHTESANAAMRAAKAMPAEFARGKRFSAQESERAREETAVGTRSGTYGTTRTKEGH